MVVGLVLAPVFLGVGSDSAPAQVPTSRAHRALNSAIDCFRRGEYELAATFYQQAQVGKDDLTAAEQQDLANGLQRTQAALQARREGGDKLRRAEEALRTGRTQDAADLIREVRANQFLTPADKQRAQQLADKLLPAGSTPPAVAQPGAGVAPLAQARAKLQQARSLMAKGNYDNAEALAVEVRAQQLPFTPNEDTPERVLEAIARARAQAAGKPEAKAVAGLPAASPSTRAETKAAAAPAPKVDTKTAPATPAARADSKTMPTPVPTAEKQDGRALLAAARQALQRNEFDKAEKLAHEAEAAQSGWGLHLFRDTPSKVLSDIHAARMKHTQEMAKSGTPKGPQSSTGNDKAVARRPSPASTGSDTEVAQRTTPTSSEDKSKRDKTAPPTGTAAARPPSNPAALGSAETAAKNTDAARRLLVEGKKALADNDLKRARELAEKARDLKPNLKFWEDNPEKLLAEIERASARSPQPPVAASAASGNKTPTPASVASSQKPASADKVTRPGETAQKGTDKAPPPSETAQKPGEKVDPRALLKQGRELFAAGKLDEAKVAALKANAAPHASWGLFEDSPDKLLGDIRKAQSKRDKEESIRLMAEARKHFEKGEFDEAERKANRAERLHGEYSIWDLGDRPRKLLAEIETARAKNRKPQLPPPPSIPGAVAQGPKPPAALPASPTPDRSLASGTPSARPAQPSTPPAPAAPAQPVASGVLPPPTEVGAGCEPPPPSWPAAPSPVQQAVGPPTVSPPVQQASVPAPAVDPNLQQARQLLSEAADLKKQGRLIEARLRVLDAQKLNASFGTEETTPERMLLELASLCEKKIEGLLQEATDYVAAGKDDPASIQKAENNLVQARGLATGFGLDPHSIETKMAWLRAQQGQAPPPSVTAVLPPPAPAMPPPPATLPVAPAPAVTSAGGATPGLAPVAAASGGQSEVPPAAVAEAPPVPPAPQPEETPKQRGAALLDKARIELRRGESATARRIAEEVYCGPYGLQTEAMALLRSIDVEEFNQKMLAANRAFDAGHSAFLRQDYGQAQLILKQIDPRMLKPEKYERLKEIMNTPQMQPTALAQAKEGTTLARPPAENRVLPGAEELRPPTAPEPLRQPANLGEGVASVPLPAPAVPGSTPLAGPAKVSDTNLVPTRSDSAPADSYAQQVQAMQEILFGKLREDGLRAQREATEAFQARNTEQALEILRSYLDSLDSANLDKDRLALLRRPVEGRLQKFKTLKAQMEYEQLAAGQKAMAHEREKRRTLAEEEKKKQVAELMRQYNTFYKEGKYKEAELAAAKAHELDPDNLAADYAGHLARVHRRLLDSSNAKKSREAMMADSLNDAENEGPAVNTRNPMEFDEAIYKNALKRDNLGKGWTTTFKNEKEREIERRLNLPITLEFKDTSLRQVIDDLRADTGINIIPDTAALEESAISLDQPMTERLEGISLKSALNILLKKVHLTYIIKDEVLQITTHKHAKGKLVQKTYPVADIVIPIDNYSISPNAQLVNTLGRMSDRQGAFVSGAQPWTGPTALQGGQPVSNPVPGSHSQNVPWAGDAPPTSTTPLAANRAPGQTHTLENVLIKLITNTIHPESWSDVGGPGTIDYFPLGMALVINQTLDIQEQIQELLDALRRLQDRQVSVEVRMIDLQEAFFERIGLDFNINVKTDRSRFEPEIVSQQFALPGFINDFSPNRFWTGITPAGNFTSDLDIPIRASSFGLAIPPFGGYPGIPGANGGLSLGLAFLSDIQVFMFMEAAQGDRRTNVMQAPKLTLFNGQTATIQIQDFQFFASNVQVLQVGGQVVFVPQNQPIPLGINLAIQAVISADQRFVRLNIAPTLANLASATVPLFPITTFITPVFEGGAQGQPIPFTQFIQQPTFTLVAIETTVSVPDGGTVLLGGLKLLNEGRNEFGPPVLSKVPYINRLFKNVGYGRDTSSLLIMVTPRIIINFEEETRQTGVVTPPPGVGGL
jgi:type II secretory pathway component GspD/PulD (secretin)